MNSFLPPTSLSIERQLLEAEQRKASRALEALLKSTKDTFDAVWNNQAKSPAQMLAAQGTQAVTNFQRHARTVTYLLAEGVNVPEQYRSAPFPYTAHSDGTITLN